MIPLLTQQVFTLITALIEEKDDPFADLHDPGVRYITLSFPSRSASISNSHQVCAPLTPPVSFTIIYSDHFADSHTQRDLEMVENSQPTLAKAQNKFPDRSTSTTDISVVDQYLRCWID